MKSIYKTKQGKSDILRLYDEKLKSLHIDHTFKTINTSFGATNLIVTGEVSNPPLILVHGSNACAPIALETYPNLHKNFRVYAIDVLSQPNKSAETRLSMKDASYGIWMNKIITTLNLHEVTLVGFSFGGLIILKTLEYDESRIKQVFLAAPAYIVNGNPLKALFKVFIPMKQYMRTQKNKYIEKFLSEVFTDRDEFAVKFLSKVFLEFEMDFTPVPIISAKKAKQIKTPMTIFSAKYDVMFPGNKMIKRASKIFPALKSSTLFENAKHVFNRSQNDLVEQDIMS